MDARGVDRRVGEGLLTAFLLAAALHVVGSVVSGIVAMTERASAFPGGRARTAQILSAFGAAGQSLDALVLLAAVALVWWRYRMSEPGMSLRPIVVARVLLVAVAVLVVVRVTGVVLFNSVFQGGQSGSSTTTAVTFGLGDLVLCVGGLVASQRLRTATAAADVEADEPVLFAVDRANGEVFAFFSRAEAGRTLAYSIEDNEFDWFSDDGRVVTAAIAPDRVTFVATESDARDALMSHLRAFSMSRSLTIPDGAEDDPLAYAAPVSDWQWLQLWPGWLRPLGRLVRALTSGH